MMNHYKYYLLIPVIFSWLIIVSSCSNDMQEIDALVNNVSEEIELAKDIVMLYSDSAVVKVRITAPTLYTHVSRTTPNQEFPDGIYVEFLNDKKQVYSWLKADYALRQSQEKNIIMRRNVVMENNRGDLIKSSELIWDENEEILHTEKYVQIIQPEQQDTTEGFGFVTNQEFTRFEIKRKGSASLNADKIKQEFLKEN